MPVQPVQIADRKILITGPTGQVARPVVERLAKVADVFALARFSKTEDRQAIEAAGATTLQADLADASSLSDLPSDFDYVLNFAVVKSGDFEYDLAANAEGVGNLMLHCRLAKAFLHFSSTAVYEYDDLQRLTEAINPLSNDETYTYDALGNRLTAANVPGTWNYNANNELLDYDTVTFHYDDNGNTTRKTIGIQQTNYTYDVEDRLIQVENETGSVIAGYYYDPFGRRLWKEVDSVRTYFLYSDEGLIGEYDRNGAEIKSYGYAPGSAWTTDPLFVKSGGTYYWYQNDHAGTPQKIIDTSGRVVWAAVYDSFGNIQIQTAEITNNLRFAGQYFDAETGLYYNLNRYYDPTNGRYLRTDPYGEGFNFYAYVSNNPNSLIDPLGLCALKDWVYSTGNSILDLMSPSEAYGAVIRPEDIGPKAYEEDFDSIKYKKTELYRIRIEYVEDPHGIPLIFRRFLPYLKDFIPLGVYKRKIYVDVQMGEHKVYYRTNTRTLKTREIASDPIRGGHTYYKTSKYARHIDYGIHPLKPLDREILDIRKNKIDKILKDIEKGQLREVYYDWRRRNQ